MSRTPEIEEKEGKFYYYYFFFKSSTKYYLLVDCVYDYSHYTNNSISTRRRYGSNAMSLNEATYGYHHLLCTKRRRPDYLNAFIVDTPHGDNHHRGP
jgi:hypothetical protein